MEEKHSAECMVHKGFIVFIVLSVLSEITSFIITLSTTTQNQWLACSGQCDYYFYRLHRQLY